MRIASLLPSATEIVYALGCGDSLIAVTHECDFPPGTRSKLAVTLSLLPPGEPSARVDALVHESKRDVHTIYALDAERLAELAPDIVLTQSLCEVCAVPRSTVEEAVCGMPSGALVVSLDPHTLDEMLTGLLEAGEALDVRERAVALVAELRTRIDTVRVAVDGVSERPRVFCCEWLDPVYRGGHWVPEQVRLAGGIDVLGREGEPSAPVSWAAVLEAEPDVLVLMPCGFDAAQAAARGHELASRPGWASLPAVRDGRVFAVDGSAYYSRPGPRLIEGLELLARILHPARFAKLAPEDAALHLTDAAQLRFEPYR